MYYVDRAGRLTNKRRTATGGFLVDATLARVGVMAYPERQEVHFNSPEVLQANLDAIPTAPVTNRHPAKMVTPVTFKSVSCGHVVGSPTFKDGMIHATLAIQDIDLIADIESGAAEEISMGYLAVSEPTEGTYDGEAYDMARKSIEWNHIAVVPAGRAGRDVCLCLDSADIPGDSEMKTLMINGRAVELDKAQAAVDALEMLLEDARGEVTELQASIVTKDAEIATAKSEATIDAAVTARLAKVEAERKTAERRAAVAKRYPKMALDGKSQETIDSLFETLTAEQAAVAAEEATVDELAPGAAGGAPSAEKKEVNDAKPAPVRVDPRAKMLERQRQLSASPARAGE